MPMDGIPIVSLTVEQMRFTMQQALSGYTAQMDKQLQEAVEQFCTPENLKNVIISQAHNELRTCVVRAVDAFFFKAEVKGVIDEVVKEVFARAFRWKEDK